MSRDLPLSLLRRLRAFTLIELLTVMAIIAILAALILSISGFANQKAAQARAQNEIQALSTALESYKADNGVYPDQMLASGGVIPPTVAGQTPSEILYPQAADTAGYAADQSQYINSSLELYQALTGDLYNNSYANSNGVPPSGTRNYISGMKSDVYYRANTSAQISGSNMVQYLSDPFGNSYGYSTLNNSIVTSGSTATNQGYNPTFDLWSTGGTITANAGGTAVDPMQKWIKNW